MCSQCKGIGFLFPHSYIAACINISLGLKWKWSANFSIQAKEDKQQIEQKRNHLTSQRNKNTLQMNDLLCKSSHSHTTRSQVLLWCCALGTTTWQREVRSGEDWGATGVRTRSAVGCLWDEKLEVLQGGYHRLQPECHRPLPEGLHSANSMNPKISVHARNWVKNKQ